MVSGRLLSKWIRAVADISLRAEPLWVVLVYFPLFVLPSFAPSFTYLGFVGLFLVSMTWILRRWRLGNFTRQSPLDLPFALFLLSAGLGLLPAKLPQYSLARLWVLVGSIVFYYILINNASDKYLIGYLMLFIVVGLLATLALLTQLPEMTEYPWGDAMFAIVRPLFAWLGGLHKFRHDNVFLWNITRNAVAGVSMVILPLTWPLAHLSSRWLTRGITILIAVLLSAILVISAGMSALVALCVGWALVAVLRKKFIKALSLTIVILLLSCGLVYLLPESAPVRYVLRNFYGRLDLWQVAYSLIRDFPMTGVGPGMENWYLALQMYPMPNLGVPCQYPGGCGFAHAHNFYLQTWAEQGILGFVALVAIVVVGLVLGVRYLRSTRGFRKAIVLGGLWSFANYIIHSLVDSGPSTPGAIGLWAMLGLMVAAGQQNEILSMDAVEDAVGGAVHKGLRKIPSPNTEHSTTTIMGATEWLGLSLFLTLASLALIGSHTLLDVAVAVGAGLALAKASLVLYDTRSNQI